MNRIARTVLVGLCASSVLTALLVTGTAAAEGKQKKPVVCFNFEVIVDSATARAKHEMMLGVCRDGKRPKLFTNWLPLTINDGERDVTFIVGF